MIESNIKITDTFISLSGNDTASSLDLNIHMNIVHNSEAVRPLNLQGKREKKRVKEGRWEKRGK